MLAASAAAGLAFPEGAYGQEWLANGGFEAGTAGWLIKEGAVISDCQAYEGSAALGASATGNISATVSTTLNGAFPATTYTLRGWARIRSGTGKVKVSLGPISSYGTPIGNQTPQDTGAGSQYTPFEMTTTVNIAPVSIDIFFNIVPDGGTIEVCIDNLSLTTVDSTTPTPSPTQTSVPVATPTPTSTATIAPDPTAVASPTAPTNTPKQAPTPRATATAGPSFVFTNGGFEQGLDGWRKYGGTLTTTSSARSGGTAGLLFSSTDSTKWAYQAVAVDPSQFYEFAGYVQPDGGVQAAYLRISWYGTSDAGGSALSTTDSTRSASPSSDFVYLTTGPVRPPANASSARVRILLAPSGADAASLRIDDVSFSTTTAPTPTLTPTETPSPMPTPSPTLEIRQLAPITSTPVAAMTPSPTQQKEEAAARVATTPGSWCYTKAGRRHHPDVARGRSGK